MPNNCSTMIKRKKDTLNQILRSNSDGKLQDDIIETTAGLCTSGTRKASDYLSPSTHQLTAASTSYRPSYLPNYRPELTPNEPYDAHLPSIRYTKGNVDRHNRSHDELHTRGRPKTPLANASPKSNGYTPSASISSIFNPYGKRSTENLMSSHGDFEEVTTASPVPLSRRSQRARQKNGFNHNLTLSQKQLTDSGVDFRFSSSSGDTNHQQRTMRISSRLRANLSQGYADSSRGQDIVIREKSNLGQLYQRRPTNTVKAPMKQKIDKYRRRSEEVIQAAYGYASVNSPSNGLPTAHPPSSTRPKPPPPTPTPTHRFASNADTQNRRTAVRLSTNPTLPQTPEQTQRLSHQHSQNRVKSPYVYPSPTQTVPTAPSSNPPTPLARVRRSHASHHPPAQATTSQQQQPQATHIINYSHQSQSMPQRQHSHQHAVNYSPRNLYFAFLASHHISTLEDTFVEPDADRQKLIRIFTWIENVEQHRGEQSDHEMLLAAQKKRTDKDEENFSLYSEIRYAVDDLPANTSGKPCDRIAPIDFEN